MTKEECVNILKYLLAKYVQDRDYVLETYKRIDEISERPPVKGIVYAIFEKRKFGFSPEDKDLLSDLEYYFG